MGKENFKYYAFISYAGADEKWARWLHHNLEHYHIPAVLCKQNNDIPSKIRPVFWYKKDLSGTVLKNALEGELDVSKYLILVCSPQAAASPWVNDEVARFISQGRASYIIPFIVGGEPHAADPSQECFPPALRDLPRDKELRGIAVEKVGKSRALVDVVATMFGVSFDTLWQRHRRRQRNIRNIWIAVCAALLLVGAGVWDYTRTRTEYYAYTTDVYGKLQGIYPLSSDQVSRRNENIRFEYRRAPFGSKDFYSWRLDKVDVVNSAGIVSATYSLSMIYPHPSLEYEYDKTGKLIRVTGLDETGHVKQTYEILDDFDGTHAGILDLKGVESGQTAAFRENSYSKDNIGSNTRIRRYHIQRDDLGRPAIQTYHATNDDDLDASAIPDEDNVYALKYSYDDKGRMKKVEHLGHDYKPDTDRFGVAAAEIFYNEPASQYDATWIGLDGKPIVREQGYASSRSTIDEVGNLLTRTTLDPEGNPVINTMRFATIACEYDKNGFRVKETTLDADSLPMLNEGNWAYCIITNDRKGRAISNKFFDENMQPTLNVEGSADTRFTFDDAGNMLSVEFFDIEGKPTLSSTNAYHKLDIKYDKAGYPVTYKYYGTDGKLCYNTSGYAERKEVYDDYHRVIEETYYDTDGNPCAANNYYQRFVISYDRRGNRIREEFYDSEGNLVVNKDGYAVYEFEFDNAGNMTRRSTFDNKRQPLYVKNYASVSDSYTPKGLLEKRIYLDHEGKPTLSEDWYAYELYSYDDAGRLMAIHYFDADSLPTITKDSGTHAISYEYDEHGNKNRIISYDTRGEKAASNSYIADLRRVYNGSRQIIEESYFDAHGNPVKDNEGIHRMVLKYDGSGKELERRFYDANGNPDVDKHGGAQYKYVYTPTGNIEKITYFGKDGRPVLTDISGSYGTLSEYNSRGLLERASFIDAEGKPMMTHQPNMMYATQVYEYDPAGHITQKKFLDDKGELARTTTSVEKYTHDRQGRIVRTEYFDYKGEPVGGPENFAAIEFDYISPDTTFIRSYDIHGANVLNRLSINENGLVVKACWTDSLGNPMLYTNRAIDENIYATAEYDFDDMHRLSEVRFYGVDGELITPEIGYAVQVRKYDEKGHLTEAKYLDNNRQLYDDPSSAAARIVISYDDRGNVTSHYWYDSKGALADTPRLYSGVEQSYDSHGNVTKTIYIYKDGTRGDHPLSPQTEVAANEANAQMNEEPAVVIVCLVETQGQMLSKGYRGYYIVLKFEDWNVETGDIDSFAETLSATRGKEKHLVLWQLDENNLAGGTVYDEVFSTEPLSARLMDYKVLPIVKETAIKKLHEH